LLLWVGYCIHIVKEGYKNSSIYNVYSTVKSILLQSSMSVTIYVVCKGMEPIKRKKESDNECSGKAGAVCNQELSPCTRYIITKIKRIKRHCGISYFNDALTFN